MNLGFLVCGYGVLHFDFLCRNLCFWFGVFDSTLAGCWYSQHLLLPYKAINAFFILI